MAIPPRSGTYQHRPIPLAYNAGWLTQETGLLQRAIPSSTCRTTTSIVVRQSGLDRYLNMDATAGAVTATLLSAALWPNFAVTFKKTDASVNAITLIGTIEGVVNPTLAARYASKIIYSDGVSLFYGP